MRAKIAVAAAACLGIAQLSSAGDMGETVTFSSKAALDGPSDPIQEPWDTVLIQGELSEPGLDIEVSRAGETGWAALDIHSYPGGRFWAKARLRSGTGSLALRSVDGEPLQEKGLTIYAVEVFAAAAKQRGKAEAVPSRRPRDPRAVRPLVHGRAEWKAKPAKETSPDPDPWRVTLHHTEGRYTDTLADSLREAKAIQDFHMQGRGWSDIAYHFLVDGEGNIIEGRPENLRGAHAGNQGLNAGNIGVVLLGSYHPPRNDQPTPRQLEAVSELGRYLVGRYGIEPSALKGHRDLHSTDCPGDILYERLDGLRVAFGAAVARLRRALEGPIRLPEKLLRRVDWNGPSKG